MGLFGGLATAERNQPTPPLMVDCGNVLIAADQCVVRGGWMVRAVVRRGPPTL
jgi:hypothetical protein